ncbi:MAG: LTA synthase family protein, partial [Firmicutes bacterium]|nr:LTA synthase family protein [Bacillota bacterium]
MIAFFAVLVGLDLLMRAEFADPAAGIPAGDPALRFTLCWAAGMTGLVCLLPDLARRIAMPLITVFWCLICVIHAVIRHLTGSFFSVADLNYAEDGAKFFSLQYLVVQPRLIVYCICAVCAVLFLSVFSKKRPWGRLPLIAGIALLAAGLGLGAAVHSDLMPEESTKMSWSVEGADRGADSYLYQDMSDANRCMELAGVYQYLWRSFVVSSGLEDRRRFGRMYEELDEWYAQRREHPHASNAYSGALEGKNCFFILLESVDTWLLTEDYMPNLYALQQQSVDCTDHYSSLFITASTFNTEFTANTGQIPPSAGLSTEAYVENTFPMSLAKLFADKEYMVRSFHSADPTIYNRGAIHHNLGYSSYSCHYNIGMDNYRLDSQLIRGLPWMIERKPFFSFILTFSGHGPYTEEFADISDPHLEAATAAVAQADIPEKAHASEEYLLAVAHAMETDLFVGELVEALEEQGLTDDTALVFFTDHYCKYMSDTDLVMELKGVSDMDMICRTPFFI